MYIHPDTDSLPGEPVRVRAPSSSFGLRVLATSVAVSALSLLTAPLWLPFAVGVLIWGWPPHQPRFSELGRFLGRTVSARPPAPGLAPLSRIYVVLVILAKLALIPVHGLAWYLDELIYGRRLRDINIVAPLIMLSAARSGSTQSAHYLEDDPRLAAPTVLEILFPYVWVWKLAPRTLGRRLSADDVREMMRRSLTEEFEQRHEGDPFRTDTLEVLFFVRRLSMLTPVFGPEAMIEELSPSSTAPHKQRFWQQDFVEFVDRLGRKTLLVHARTPDGAPTRLFIKGHFIDARDALARRYADAHFLTVIREPVSRIRSHLNHLHANPFEETLGAVPWTWLAAYVVEAEVAYCEIEQQWFTAADGPARTVIRFDEFVADLEGTMSRIYRECLGVDVLPSHVPTEHTPRERTHYRVDRSLEQVGIDPAALAERLSRYRAWVRGP